MEPLDERALAFLHESNAIEEITNIDYRQPENARAGAGHVGAFLDAQELAAAGRPLGLDDVCRWQRWLTEEQQRFGHSIPANGIGVLRSPLNRYNVFVGNHVPPSYDEVPALVARWLADLEQRLAEAPSAREWQAADLLGEYFQRFESIHPFVDGNGRTGRLVAAYLAARCGRPLIVFRADERPAYYAAHRSKLAMRVFMAEKIAETVGGADGRVYTRLKELGMGPRFLTAHAERRQLQAQLRDWRAQLATREGRAASALLDEREREFLRESDAIDGVSPLDYDRPEHARAGAGHVGAFLDAMQRAALARPLAVDDLCRWHRWLAEEQPQRGLQMPPLDAVGVPRGPHNRRDVTVGSYRAPSYAEVPALLDRWLADAEARLAALRWPEDEQIADLLGELFYRFVKLMPFVSDNGRVGRLVVGYLAMRCRGPIIVFRAAERAAYLAAHRSANAMRIFMADKLRETFIDLDGIVYPRLANHGAADRFATCLVERHALLAQVARWQARLDD